MEVKTKNLRILNFRLQVLNYKLRFLNDNWKRCKDSKIFICRLKQQKYYIRDRDQVTIFEYKENKTAFMLDFVLRCTCSLFLRKTLISLN